LMRALFDNSSHRPLARRVININFFVPAIAFSPRAESRHTSDFDPQGGKS